MKMSPEHERLIEQMFGTSNNKPRRPATRPKNIAWPHYYTRKTMANSSKGNLVNYQIFGIEDAHNIKPFTAELAFLSSEKGYIYSFTRGFPKGESISSFIDELIKDEWKATDLLSNDHSISKRFELNDIIVYIHCSKDEPVALILSNLSYDSIAAFLSKYVKVKEETDTYYDVRYLFKKDRGIGSGNLLIKTSEFDDIYSELYPDIDIEELAFQYINTKESILILTGDPGVGKTTFIKHIIKYLHRKDLGGKEIIYIKDPDALADGELWAYLASSNDGLIIFDDLDIKLLPRSKNESNQFITQLLSLSDGIFTTSRNKIIITTNQPIEEIDSALIRDGRCFDFIHLRSLSQAQAKDIWTDVLNQDLNNFIFKTNTITQAELMSYYKKLINGHSRRTYNKNNSEPYTIEQKLRQLGIKSSSGVDTAWLP